MKSPTVFLLFLCGALLALLSARPAEADEWFEVWHNSDQWDVVDDAMLDPGNPRQLVGKPGKGILINGKNGRAKSLVTQQSFQDVEVHLEFIVAKYSNSGERNPCPIEFRNIFIKEIHSTDSSEPRGLNVPPPGFTALFNGKDFTGWHTPPLVKQYWTIEDGVLKSPGLIETWGASLVTEKKFRDFVLLVDFRMPTISDSGISFRRLIPQIQGFGDMEQFNLRSKGGMAHLESYYFLPNGIARRMKLREEEEPHVRHIEPEVGVWHTVKLTMQGRTFSAEYDGELLYDRFQYHDWMMNMEPAPIVLQKHIVVHRDNLGAENPCPIEYRNIFIKELE